MTTPSTPTRDGQSVPPWEMTRVAGTDLEVWHDDKSACVVTVLSDGAIDLPGGPTWIVRAVDR